MQKRWRKLSITGGEGDVNVVPSFVSGYICSKYMVPNTEMPESISICTREMLLIYSDSYRSSSI